MLGGRSPGMVLRNAVRPANYRAVLNMPRRYLMPAESARRYFSGGGPYPWRCPVRTRTGTVAPTLYSRHDMLTVNEVFCREDYRVDGDARSIVDVGSNIGISALYFLTEAPSARVWLFEPVPRNVERLRENMAGFEDRYRVEQAAVADTEGTLPFAIEPAGRYGGLDRREGERISVRVRHVNNVLEEVLVETGWIDVLKLDTEGAEARTVAAIAPELLRRVSTIYLEAEGTTRVALPGFRSSSRCETLRLQATSSEGAVPGQDR